MKWHFHVVTDGAESWASNFYSVRQQHRNWIQSAHGIRQNKTEQTKSEKREKKKTEEMKWIVREQNRQVKQ